MPMRPNFAVAADSKLTSIKHHRSPGFCELTRFAIFQFTVIPVGFALKRVVAGLEIGWLIGALGNYRSKNGRLRGA